MQKRRDVIKGSDVVLFLTPVREKSNLHRCQGYWEEEEEKRRRGAYDQTTLLKKPSSEEAPGGKAQREACVGVEGGEEASGDGVGERQFSISPGFWPKRQQSI